MCQCLCGQGADKRVPAMLHREQDRDGALNYERFSLKSSAQELTELGDSGLFYYSVMPDGRPRSTLVCECARVCRGRARRN